MVSSSIISAHEITKGFGEEPLFSDLSIAIGERDRVALIGSNGSGKSTLLKILAGVEDVDAGSVSIRKGLRCAYVPQQEDFPSGLSVSDVLEESLTRHGVDPGDIARRTSVTLGVVGFTDRELRVSDLSGGWRKRLAIACALALEPDCLLLDEPTNHLDLSSIAWLEECVEKLPCAVVFVSHDRYFIERVATRVMELNRRYPRDYIISEGGYADYIEYREQLLAQLQQQRQSLANKVRREVEWLRQGVKARTTKSRARINEAHRLIDTLKGFSSGDQERATLEFSATQRKTKELIKVESIAQGFDGRELFSNVSLVLSPGSRLAVVGANGSGKTTFIRTLLGDLAPRRGRVIRAPNLRVAFMDQARDQMKPEITLQKFLAPDSNGVVFQGESIHVNAWADRFLFTRDHLASSLGTLSGGERARALLAKIMLEEADVLLFDEPTNDLDIATLENLEESFEAFPGALVLISHDRYLLDKTARMVLGLRDGVSAMYGSYSQWERERHEERQSAPKKREERREQEPSTRSGRMKKLSYKDERDLKRIEGEIEKAESALAATRESLDSGLYASDPVKLTELCNAVSAQEQEVERLYERWQALETLKKDLDS